MPKRAFRWRCPECQIPTLDRRSWEEFTGGACGLRLSGSGLHVGVKSTGFLAGGSDLSEVNHVEGTRRDFIHYATASTGVVAGGAAIWPLVDQMNPSADVQALSSIEVDVSGVEPGTQITVKWRGKPVFIRRRTDVEIEAARAVAMDQLIDTLARNGNIDSDAIALDENRSIDEEGTWLVMVGVCSHLGCVPLGDEAGDYGGWFCPCHGSHYDTSGRIRRGPAPENMEVPVAAFIDESTIKLG
ncbi:MAG: ubiquinol-cytochrome c reductase iron-sulfur subunit [Rhodobacteraceae bacterium]|nr:ubiquinol-cytochrome c reductase iron-sulfur subunit [Paracoccaceae bacterium]